MKLLFQFAVTALCVGMVYSAASLIRLPPNAPKPEGFEDKEGCYVEEINDVIPYGKTISAIDDCYKIACEKNSLYHESCPPIPPYRPDPKCKVVEEDVNKPYPACCQHKLICDGDSE